MIDTPHSSRRRVLGEVPYPAEREFLPFHLSLPFIDSSRLLRQLVAIDSSIARYGQLIIVDQLYLFDFAHLIPCSLHASDFHSPDESTTV